MILLNYDEDAPKPRTLGEQDISNVLKVSAMKIHRTKQRFVEECMDVALNGRKGERVYRRKADGDFEAHLVALSCSDPPEGQAQWSLRLLADQVVELGYIESISHETIRRVLKKRDQTLAESRLGHSTQPRYQFFWRRWNWCLMCTKALMIRDFRLPAWMNHHAS